METSTPSLQSLAGRVERLEEQNRWLRRAGLAVLLLAAAVGVMA